MADIVLNNFMVIGIIGVLLGTLFRTLHPFVRKVFLGEFSWPDFQRSYIVLFVSALGTGFTFYLGIGPLTADLVVEFILGFTLGLAGQEVFNAVYKYVLAYFEGRNSREVTTDNQ